MKTWHRSALVMGALLLLAGTARADQPAADPFAEPATAAPADPFAAPSDTTLPGMDDPLESEEEEEEEDKPGRGDFDAGGQVRLPAGPDEMGQYATFNWIAVDLEGRYFLLDWATINGEIPLAIIKPDSFGGIEPKLFGGMKVFLDIDMPEMPFQPEAYESDIGLILTGAYMREGAMTLSEKDFPLFFGDFKPGFAAGTRAKIKLSSLIDFSTTPLFFYQAGTDEALNGLQIPVSTIIKLGDVVKLSADLGFFSGDNFSFKGDGGGRISAGGALTVKIGPILAHAGAGVASLLTGEDALYPTIGDSLYIDLNVKYAK